MENILNILYRRRLVNEQIDVYLAYGKKCGISSEGHRKWLDLFIRRRNKVDITEIDDEDIVEFISFVRSRYNGEYPILEATRAINGITRFYSARTKNFKAGLSLWERQCLKILDIFRK